MQAQKLAIDPDDARQRLEQALAEAIGRATRFEFDLPGPSAMARAAGLFDALAATEIRFEAIEVSIAVDGAIAVGASNATLSAIVEFDPSSGHGELVVSDTRDRRITRVAKEPSNEEIVRELERAA